jgi:hypothetical protein
VVVSSSSYSTPGIMIAFCLGNIGPLLSSIGSSSLPSTPIPRYKKIRRGHDLTHTYFLFFPSSSSISIALTLPDLRVGSTTTFLLFILLSFFKRVSVFPFSTLTSRGLMDGLDDNPRESRSAALFLLSALSLYMRALGMNTFKLPVLMNGLVL